MRLSEKFLHMERISPSGESWAYLTKTQGLIFISNMGRVYKFENTFTFKGNFFNFIPGRLAIITYEDRHGKVRTIDLAQYVARYFMQVNTKTHNIIFNDGNPSNFSTTNLTVIPVGKSLAKSELSIPAYSKEDWMEYFAMRRRLGLCSEAWGMDECE